MLPVFDNESSTTRDKIISILAAEPNLNTKRLNAILKKQFALNVTYQAIHKTLKQMVDQDVLIHEEKGYSINPKWIDELRLFTQKVSENSNEEIVKPKYHKIGEFLETIEVGSFQETEKLFFEFREDYFKNILNYKENERIICYHAPHLQIAVNSPRKEYEFMDRLLKNKTKLFCLCKGNTIVDKWIEKFYNSQKGKTYSVKTGANCSSINEVWIYPDKLIEVFFSEKFWDFFDHLYAGIKKIEDVNYSTIIEKLYSLNNEPVRILVHKDKSIVTLGIRETLKQFK